MEKSAIVDKANLDVLSTELFMDLQIEDNIQETNKLPMITQEKDYSETGCSSDTVLTNIAQYGPNKKSVASEETPFEYHERSDDSEGYQSHALKEYFEEYSEHLESVSGVKSFKKKKHATSRMKQRDYNIISKKNASPRLPSYFKFDKSTTGLLEMLIKHRHVGEYHNVIAKGLTSVVIHAHCYGRYHIYFPCGNAVKVYKLSNDIERNNSIFLRVQRENDVLVILRNKHFGNNFPHPVYNSRNVIVMSFIGADQESAPSITSLSETDSEETYHLIVKEMDSWYNKLNLVHGNLSSKTILHWQGIPHFVGWSHSVPKEHPKALKRLIKDCRFVTKFFEKRSVPVKSMEELIKSITGLDNLNNKLLDMMHDKHLWEDQKLTNPNRSAKTNSVSGKHRF